MSDKETIVALKSDEQASLSPGAYEVLTGAVEQAGPGPLSALRMKLRAAVAGFKWLQQMAPGEYAKMAELLEAPEWMQAAEEANALRTQLAHWKTFAVHSEGEHAAWKKTATELDAELRALRDPAPLVAWITEGGCECLQRGEGPVRVMPEENHEAGFTVPLYARERPAQQKDCRECAMQPCDTCPDVPGADDVRLMRQAMEALIAHRRQTRPIATTEDAIEALRKRLGPNH